MLLQRTARWLVDDADRKRQRQQHDLLAAGLERGHVQFVDSEGRRLGVAAMPRGAIGLGWVFWLLSTLGLLLYLVTMVVMLARPGRRNTLYALLSLMQCGNLAFLAVLSTPGVGWPEGFMRWEHDARTAFDLITVGALVHVTNLHPRHLPQWRQRVAMAWVIVAAVLVLAVGLHAPSSWWITQGTLLAGGVLAIVQLVWMQRREPHPLAVQCCASRRWRWPPCCC